MSVTMENGIKSFMYRWGRTVVVLSILYISCIIIDSGLGYINRIGMVGVLQALTMRILYIHARS